MTQAGVRYARTSTKDQHPELQAAECLAFEQEHEIELIVEPIEEQESAYKKKGAGRKGWEQVVALVRERKVSCVVLWKYDRAFRNRAAFVSFMREAYEVYGCRVYSVTERWVHTLWQMIDELPAIPAPWDQVMKDLLGVMWRTVIQIVGETGEEESRNKGKRVRMAVRKREGVTVSYKGNRWGRKPLPASLVGKVAELRAQGKSIRQIAEQVTFWDAKGKERRISRGAVHKILGVSSEGKDTPQA